MQHDEVVVFANLMVICGLAHFGVVIGDRMCEGYVRLNELTAGI
jgi:hypothetical protein